MLTALPWLARYLRLLRLVDIHLHKITQRAHQIEPTLLRQQALLSIENKAFHCYGGSVMALLSVPNYRDDLVALIVYLQTISDYLDNLCDRAGITDADAFLILHQSMQDAISPGASIGSYYSSYGIDENNYLPWLVTSCQAICRRLPSWEKISGPLKSLVDYYSHLQAYKHMPWADREKNLQTYLAEQVPNPDGLSWWELAAATGSTLGMFTLLALSSYDDLNASEVEAAADAYFPWVCGLHIMLDYLIDLAEDIEGGDLNFVTYYPDTNAVWLSLHNFVQSAQRKVLSLPNSSFHLLVISGLLAMYMSDHKVQLQGVSSQARTLIRSAGSGSLALYRLCSLMRRLKGVK